MYTKIQDVVDGYGVNRYILNFRQKESYAFEFIIPAYDEYEYEMYIIATSQNPIVSNAFYYTEVQKIAFKTESLVVEGPKIISAGGYLTKNTYAWVIILTCLFLFQ